LKPSRVGSAQQERPLGDVFEQERAVAGNPDVDRATGGCVIQANGSMTDRRTGRLVDDFAADRAIPLRAFSKGPLDLTPGSGALLTESADRCIQRRVIFPEKKEAAGHPDSLA
jgi:hypothetical protein